MNVFETMYKHVAAQSDTVITADQGVRGGKIIELKHVVDTAVAKCPSVKRVFVYQRTGADVPMSKIDINLDKVGSSIVLYVIVEHQIFGYILDVIVMLCGFCYPWKCYKGIQTFQILLPQHANTSQFASMDHNFHHLRHYTHVNMFMLFTSCLKSQPEC